MNALFILCIYWQAKPFTFAWKPTNISQLADKTNVTPTAELYIQNWKQADLEAKAMLGKLEK